MGSAAWLKCWLTNSGSIKGKIAYVAPEQLRAFPVDARSDIYAYATNLGSNSTRKVLARDERSSRKGAMSSPTVTPRHGNPTGSRKGLWIGLTAIGIVALGTGAFLAMQRAPSPSAAQTGPLVATRATAGDAAVPAVPAATEPIANPSQDVKLYLDEVQRLADGHRWDAAAEMLAKAQAKRVDDAALTIRMSRLADEVAIGPARDDAKRALDAKDRAGAIAAAGKVLERKPDDAVAADILAAAQAVQSLSSATLAPTSAGTLTVRTRPGALIYLDGELIGRGSVVRRTTTKGNHDLIVKLAGFAPAHHPVTVVARRETGLSITLTPEVAAVTPREVPHEPTPTPTPTPHDTGSATAPTPTPHDTGSTPAPTPTPIPTPTPTPTPTPKPVPTPTPTPTPPVVTTEIAAPRLPGKYSARSMNELSKVLSVIEGEAIERGKAPASIRGVTSGLAEEAFANFAPGQLIEVAPSAIYYEIVRQARAGKAPGAIASSLRTAYSQGKLAP